MSARLAGFGVVLLAAVVLAAVVLAPPTPSPAQTPAAKPPPSLEAGYVGAETCKACHEDQHKTFESTKMGRLFLKHPRNTREAPAARPATARARPTWRPAAGRLAG
jgi:cytochrome c553